MYKIGELSKLCGISVQTLRFYDSEGLLVPEKTDPFTGYRYYSVSQLALCSRIVTLKELGFSLNEIKTFNQSSAKALLKEKIDELELNSMKINQQIGILETMMCELDESSRYEMHLMKAESTIINVAYVTGIYQNREVIHASLCELRNKLPKNILGERNAIIEYELDYENDHIHCDICVEIIGRLSENSGVQTKKVIFKGDYAAVFGDISRLDICYHSLLRQVKNASFQITGALTEILYENGTVELKLPIYSKKTNKETSMKNQNYEFVNDPNVIGKWAFYDLLPDKEMFSPKKAKYKNHDEIWLKEIYFLPNGEGYWIFKSWTKGSVIQSYGNPTITVEHPYHIEEHEGAYYLFLKFADSDSAPEYYIFKKLTDISYEKSDIRIYDDVDFPFEMDDRILGNWYSYDFVHSIDEFNPAQRSWNGNLFYKKVIFKEDGTAESYYGENINPYKEKWTRGTLLDQHQKLAQAYHLLVIEGRECLFIEWKSGDYMYGKRAPLYYVFTR